jgi:hypothetical protein
MSLSQASMATPITLNASFANGTVLGAGNHTGVFDGAGLFPSNYQINSASFVFDFADDQDSLSTGPAQFAGSSATGYTSNGYYYDGSNYRYEYVRSVTNYQTVQKTGQGESVSVSLGGIAVGSGSTTMSQSSSTDSAYTGRVYETTTGQGGYYYTYGCGNHTCGGWSPGYYNQYYADNTTQTTTTTTDWTGNFSVSGNITDQFILSQLLSTNQLQLGFSVAGDLALTGAHLYLDVSQTEPTSDVPEPPTMLLMFAGLLGLVGWQRSKRSTV